MMMVGGEKIVKCENLIEIETDRNWRRAQFIEGWLITQGKPNENKSAKIYNLLESCAKKKQHISQKMKIESIINSTQHKQQTATHQQLHEWKSVRKERKNSSLNFASIQQADEASTT